MSEKPTLTPKGLLAESFGRRPHTVRLREEYEGGPVLLDFGKPRRWETLGYPVRCRDARNRWVWDHAALKRARNAAEDRAAEFRLGQLREKAAPNIVTLSVAYDLYFDPERGGIPDSRTAKYEHLRNRKDWEGWLGKDIAWNSISPADVEGLLRKYIRQGMRPTARERLKTLRTVYHWLRKKRKLRTLDDPTEGIELADVMAGHKPRRPKYTPEEAWKIVSVRDQVDARFALFIALIDDSGHRREAIRRTMRSGLDAQMDHPPTAEEAPCGWLALPALKGQRPPLLMLTSFQRREIDRALTTYLRELERIYQETGKDYPLFPASRLKGAALGIIRPSRYLEQVEGRTSWGKTSISRAPHTKAYQPISAARTREWLIEAEKVAGLAHVDGRGFHGFRRAVSDYLHGQVGLGALTVALGWSSERTPEQIYLEKEKHGMRGQARAAMERKRAVPDVGEL
jgi:integrase